MAAEAELSLRAGEASRSSEVLLDELQIGVAAAQGGLAIDRLLADNFLERGLEGLSRLEGKTKGIVEKAKKIVSVREPAAAVEARDAEWSRSAYTPYERLRFWALVGEFGQGIFREREARIDRLLEELDGETAPAPDPTRTPTSPPR